jgi:hypothetical protein
MRTLKTRKLLIALVAGSFVFAVIQGAMGITRDQCKALDGYFSPPNASGVYWCLTKNKTLISCGGSIPFCTAMRRVDNGRLHDRTIRKIIELRGTEGGYSCLQCLSNCGKPPWSSIGGSICRAHCYERIPGCVVSLPPIIIK